MSIPLLPPPDGQEFLTVAETAAAVGAARRTVLCWLKRGGFLLGAIQTPGGHWRVPADTVRALRAELGITEESTS